MVAETATAVENLSSVAEGTEFEVLNSSHADAISSAGMQALRPGSRWRCRLNGHAIVLLHSPAGRLLSLRADQARYIQVRVLKRPTAS
jgi:hypothetical protein